MSFAYIRQHYKVPAKRGQRIRYTWDLKPAGFPEYGTIITSAGAHLRVRFDGERKLRTLHPTWEIEYLAGAA